MKEKIVIVEEEITTIDSNGIICYTNTELEMTERVSLLLTRCIGEKIQDEWNRFEKLTKGDAIITPIDSSSEKYIIHAIVCNLNEEEEDGQEEDLMQATRNALNRAKEYGMKTITFPLIALDFCSIPIKRAAELIMAEVKKHLDMETSLDGLFFVADTNSVYDAFEDAYKQL